MESPANPSDTPRAADSSIGEATDALNTAPAYETPAIITHSGDDLLADLGPAQACYPYTSGGIGD